MPDGGPTYYIRCSELSWGMHQPVSTIVTQKSGFYQWEADDQRGFGSPLWATLPSSGYPTSRQGQLSADYPRSASIVTAWHLNAYGQRWETVYRTSPGVPYYRTTAVELLPCLSSKDWVNMVSSLTGDAIESGGIDGWTLAMISHAASWVQLAHGWSTFTSLSSIGAKRNVATVQPIGFDERYLMAVMGNSPCLLPQMVSS